MIKILRTVGAVAIAVAALVACTEKIENMPEPVPGRPQPERISGDQ